MMKLELSDEQAAALERQLRRITCEITSRLGKQRRDAAVVRVRAVSEPNRERFLDAARRLAAKDCNRLADPEDVATELGIGLYEVTELVRRYQESFDLASIPIGKLRPRRDCR
jgi:hypothetical protein